MPRHPAQLVLDGTTAARPPSDDPALIDVTFVVVDLETTGGSARDDRITEIGAVRVRGGDRIGQFSTLVHPGRPIPRAITAVTGITDAHVAGHPRIEAVLPAWLEFARGAVLVAHSARFDLGFLNAALERHGFPRHDQVVVDTVALARRLVRDEVRNLRLATLANHFRARVSPCHRALPDAQATVDVLHALLERAGSLGATTLDELVDLCRVTSLPAYQRIDLVRDAPRAAGVYRFLGAGDEVLYIGKAADLRSRLRTYFGQDPRRRMGEMVRRTQRVEWQVVATAVEAEAREIRAIGRHRPAYNRRSRHPERRVHLALTREPFPRLVPSTAAGVAARALLGPLPRRRAVAIAEAVAEAFDLRTCTTRLRARADHPPCVLKEIGRCPSPCDGTQARDDYAGTIAAARAALLDDPTELLDRLERRMAAASAAERYERASRLRDQAAVVAREVLRWRRQAAVARVPRLVAARPSEGPAHGWDVLELRHGRVRRSWWVARRPSPDAFDACTAVVDLVDQPVAADEAEEVDLVVRWLRAPGLVLIAVDGTWAEPVAGTARCRDVVAAAPRRARRASRVPPP